MRLDYYVCNELEFRFQVQRLAEYERYLGQEARNLGSADNGNGVGSGAVLQRGQLEGDLHRIQELFPNDNLRLHEQDVLTTVMDFPLSFAAFIGLVLARGSVRAKLVIALTGQRS
jgi:hypothetical protein